MLVLSWMKTNLKWCFISKFGFMKKRALEDITKYGESLEDIEIETPFPTEMEIGNDYKEFWKRSAPFSMVQRMQLFLFVALISLVVILMQILRQKNMDLIATVKGNLTLNQYIFWISLVLLFVSLYVLVSDSIKLNNFPDYKEGDEARAERWLALIGEKERKGIPFWLNSVSFMALFLEAFVFGITVFTVVTDLVTRQIAIIIGIIIGVVAALILHTLSFKAGKSLYALFLSKRLLDRMREDAKRNRTNEKSHDP